jgi:histidinol-phosphatase (PHP family)
VTAADLAARPDLLEPVLEAIVESGVALEVNTSGLRHPSAETYPAAATVERFNALGGRRVTAGSDAHRPEWFAYRLAAAYAIIEAAGFTGIAFRRGGSSVEVPLPERDRA